MKKVKKYNVVPAALLFIGSIIMVFPFVWMVLSSFKTTADVVSYPPRWLPSVWVTDSYAKVFELVPFITYYGNSIYTSVAQTALQITVSIFAAYPLAKLQFPGKHAISLMLRSSLFIPGVVTTIPLFFIVSKLRLVDTYAGIILPQIFSAFIIMMLISFFSELPNELNEAAIIDGCSYYRILFSVIIPNSVTAITTATLFSFLGHWKSYLWPLIVTNRTSLRTLPIGLKYLIQETSNDYEVMMAAAVMTVVPVLLLYICYEKQLVKSITLTGIK